MTEFIARSRSRLSQLFIPPFPCDADQLSFIHHLFWDIAWSGVLSGTVGSFLIVYATRMQASELQVGLLNGISSLVILLVAIPAGNMIEKNRSSQVVSFSAFLTRIFYLPVALLPFFLAPAQQIQAFIAILVIMSVPLTFLNVSSSALTVERLPPEQRAYVGGVKNGLFAITSLVFALGSGKLLTVMPVPLGYQVVFFVGFLGAMMSSYHLYKIRNSSPVEAVAAEEETGSSIANGHLSLRKMNPRYRKVIALIFAFQIAQWLVIAVNPLFAVHTLRLSDFEISIGSSMFSLVSFLFAIKAAQVTSKYGNHKSVGWSMVGLASYPLLLSVAKGFEMYVVANLIGAFSWVIFGIALVNYLFENTPVESRKQHLAYYILTSNAAVLIGSLAGPLIGGSIGYAPALAIFGVLRLLAGIAVLVWG